MRFTVDSNSVLEALKIILRLSPPAQGGVNLLTNGSKAWLSAYNELNACIIQLPGKVEGEANFAIPIDALQSAIKGREELEVSYKNSVLKLKSGRYFAELSTTDALIVDDQLKSNGEQKVVKIDPEQGQWLRNAVSSVALKPTLLLSSFMPVGVSLNDKRAFVSCYDQNHMAFTSSKEIKGNHDFVVPIDMFQGILEAFSGQPFTLTVTDAMLLVKSKLAEVRLALPHQDENSPSFTDVIGKAREVQKAQGQSLVLNKEEVLAFLDNSRAVAVKERSEVKVHVDGKAHLSVTTVNGNVKAQIKAECKKKMSFAIDYEYFDELARKCGDEMHLSVIDNAFMVAKTSRAVVIATFNQ